MKSYLANTMNASNKKRMQPVLSAEIAGAHDDL